MGTELERVIKELELRPMMPDGPMNLDRMKAAVRRIFESVGELDPDRVIVVAGTNGKGSTCATLETLLLSASQKVALYTSPHLTKITERIRINGEEISEEEFCFAYTNVLPLLAELGLTHFEMLTAMAVFVFCSARPRLDYFIFEVGLGGTWDATNAVPHSINVITALGLDHQNLLGDTLQSVAANKFGIVGKCSAVIHTELSDSLTDLINRTKHSTMSNWTNAPKYDVCVEKCNGEPVFYVESKWGRAEITLPGLRGAENTNLALSVFEQLGFDPRSHLGFVKTVKWPGRMEKVSDPGFKCPIYLSGDHNPQGVKSLIELLKHYKWERLHLLIGIGRDKDFRSMLEMFSALPNVSIYLTETPYRGLTVEEYDNANPSVLGLWKDPVVALKEIQDKVGINDLIIVTGSLYLVGLLRPRFKEAFFRPSV